MHSTLHHRLHHGGNNTIKRSILKITSSDIYGDPRREGLLASEAGTEVILLSWLGLRPTRSAASHKERVVTG